MSVVRAATRLGWALVRPSPSRLPLAAARGLCTSTPLSDAELKQAFPELYAFPPGASGPELPPPASSDLVQDAGRYFSLDETRVPEGLPVGLAEEFELVGVQELMVREPALRVIAKLERIMTGESPADGEDSPLTVLRGRSGSGKSAALSHVVHWCRENGWIVMFAPRPRDWVTEKGALKAGTGTAAPLSVSKLHPGFYGQPLGAQEMLRFMVESHGEQLSALPQRREYGHTRYLPIKKEGEAEGTAEQATTKGPSTLMHIVERGLKSLVSASDALYDLRLELSLVEEYPVLIAVDEINALYGDTCFYSQGKEVRPEELLLASAFRLLGPRGSGDLILPGHAPKNGAIVCCATERYPVDSAVLPFREAVELVPPGNVVFVKTFDEEEIKTALQHYTDHGQYCSPKGTVDDEDVAYMKLVTLGVPAECRRRAEGATAAFGTVPAKRIREKQY